MLLQDCRRFGYQLYVQYLACAESYGILGIAFVAPPPKFTIESRHS